MNDNNRTHNSEAMEKIITNMTAENIDGQYVPLGIPHPTPSEPLNWAQPPYVNQFNSGVEQYPPQPFNFIPHMFEPNGYKKTFNNLPEADMYSMQHNGAADVGLFDRDYNYIPNIPHVLNNVSDHPLMHPQETVRKNPNHTQLIDHLVGNWMVPNNSGTYSPFGSPESYKPNVFDLSELSNANVIHQMSDDPKYKNEVTLEDVQFQFNRDTRKPRIVAEVKPMRPSYSDVLTKPVPQQSVKPLKSDTKESKVKKEGKKNTKNDKNQKVCVNINRSNTNNDIKDLPTEKVNHQAKMEKKCNGKDSQLNRKWASLDNITDPQTKLDDSKKKKSEDTKTCSKNNFKKCNKTVNDIIDDESEGVKNESFSVTKNGVKKINKPSVRPKLNDSFGTSDRPPGKRNQRTRKRETHVPFGIFGQKLKQYTKGWWKILTGFLMWLFLLISDICLLSLNISRDMASISWCWLLRRWSTCVESTGAVLGRLPLLRWLCGKLQGRPRDPSAGRAEDEGGPRFAHPGLPNNISMPTTGDEAMKRLLACKGKDPYSILGVSPACTDEDIKRYYKRQAFLVHPDKNNQPGAEEAFKILVHAFDMIGKPERRASYDRGVVESAQVAQAWSELTELLQQLQQKVESAANTIRCSSCGLRHKRVKIDRPGYAARNCNTCKIHHSAREGDIWAEAKVMGFLWHYYACMEGAVYDITEWAGCQKDSLKHLRPDSHNVQYRIALGKQNQPRRHAGAAAHTDRPDLENLLNTLYGQSDGAPSSRRRNKKNK
ncbi:unnamed protein product [Phaedon cochleariae]|uniref:J domain-containing protein n=1 Tax=Phaedon cochleariae TaxID=80249 RepID=A0A9P0GT81_PHACE|nr:unnamed protein product [Phaedon cochleariae]